MYHTLGLQKGMYNCLSLMPKRRTTLFKCLSFFLFSFGLVLTACFHKRGKKGATRGPIGRKSCRRLAGGSHCTRSRSLTGTSRHLATSWKEASPLKEGKRQSSSFARASFAFLYLINMKCFKSISSLKLYLQFHYFYLDNIIKWFSTLLFVSDP